MPAIGRNRPAIDYRRVVDDLGNLRQVLGSFDRMHPDGYILQRGPPVPAARIAAGCYFVVPLGLVLLGLVVVLLLPLVDPPVLLPLEELDLLKYASHSERDTCPSLFVSTVEKLGAMLLDALLPPLDVSLEELPPLEPVALGDDDLSVLEAPLDDEPAAMDTPAIAKSAAAVAVPTSFNIWRFLLHKV